MNDYEAVSLTSREQMRTFLNTLFGDKPERDLIHIWTFCKTDGMGKPRSFFVGSAAEAIKIAEHEKSSNIFFGCGTRCVVPQGGQRGTSKDVIGIPGVWLDLDISDGTAHKSNRTFPDKASAWKFLDKLGLEPTVVVDSGHGLHVYYLFNRFHSFSSDEDRERMGNLCRRFTQQAQAKAERMGFSIDPTGDLPRVLRLPGTWNMKPGCLPVLCTLLSYDGPLYTVEELEAWCGESSPPNPVSKRVSNRLDKEVGEADADYWLHRYVGDAMPGNRHNAGILLAGQLGVLVKHGKMDMAGCEAYIREFGRLTDRPGDPYTEGEIQAALKVARNPKHEELARRLPPGSGVTGGPPISSIADAWHPLSHADLVDGEVPPIRWLVEDLMPAGTLCLLAGDSGVGKSWICFHLGQAVAAGVPFLGRFATTLGAVMYLDSESGENLLRRRMKKLWNGLLLDSETLSPDLPMSVLPAIMKLKSEGLEALSIKIHEEGVRLLILDPMVHFADGDENSSRDIVDFLEGLRRLARDTGCTVLLVHHVRKESKMHSNASSQMIRGSSAIRGVMDSVLYARKVADGRILVEHDKSRHTEPVPSFLVEISDDDDETTTVRYVGEREGSAARGEVAEAVIMRVLEAAPDGVLRQDLVGQGKSESISERTISDALRSLVQKKEVEKSKQGKQTLYRTCSVSLLKLP